MSCFAQLLRIALNLRQTNLRHLRLNVPQGAWLRRAFRFFPLNFNTLKRDRPHPCDGPRRPQRRYPPQHHRFCPSQPQALCGGRFALKMIASVACVALISACTGSPSLTTGSLPSLLASPTQPAAQPQASQPQAGQPQAGLAAPDLTKAASASRDVAKAGKLPTKSGTSSTAEKAQVAAAAAAGAANPPAPASPASTPSLLPIQVPAIGLPTTSYPEVVALSPLETYERIALQATQCWFAPGGAFYKKFIFHAEAPSPTEKKPVNISFVRNTGNIKSRWGTNVYRVLLTGDSSTDITFKNFNFDIPTQAAVRNQILAWAHGKTTCNRLPVSSRPAPSTAGAKTETSRTTTKR